MTWPFPVPDWMPWWVPLAVLVPALLYLLVFLVMPFSVFGLKGRLDQIEARLDEIQDDIRRLAARPRAQATDEVEERAPPRLDAPPPLRAEPLAPPPRRRPPDDTPRRTEPRLDWPRP